MKNRISKIVALLSLVFALTLVSAPNAAAQCPMCKMGAESNLNNGGTAAKGLNSGILYMFATPYLVVGSIVFLWWYYRKREDDEEKIELGTSEYQLGKDN